MPVVSRRSIVAFWLVLALARQTFAQDLCLVPQPDLPPPRPVTPAEPGTDKAIEVSTTGGVSVGADSEAEFSGNIEIKYGDTTITAQRGATVLDGDVDVPGRVNVVGPDVTVFGDAAHVASATDTISLSGAGFELPKPPARGSAEHIEITSESRVSLAKVLFTTCPPENMAWEISARDINLDINGGVGDLRQFVALSSDLVGNHQSPPRDLFHYAITNLDGPKDNVRYCGIGDMVAHRFAYDDPHAPVNPTKHGS